MIRLFTKNPDGKAVTCFVRGFKPYFYVNPDMDSVESLGALIEELKQRFPQILDVEVVERILPFGYQESKKKMLMIVAKDPKQVRDLRESMKSYGYVYEADILFKNRFMVDTGIFSNSWIRVENWRPTNTNTVFTDLKIETLASNISGQEEGDHPDLRHLCLDIECLADTSKGLPQPQTDPVIMISLAFSEPFEGRDDLVLVSRPVGIEGSIGLENEEEMFRRFTDIVRKYDPDVILGYNSNEFDLPYIIDRMRELGIKGRIGRADKNIYYRKIGNRSTVSIPGRVVVDVLPLVRRDFPLKRYGLGQVAKEILGKDKLDVAHTEIPTLWKSQGKGLEKLVEYSRRDAQLTLEILMSKNLLDRYVALAQASGTFLQDLIEAGQSIMIDNLLLRELRVYERVMPCKPDEQETARRREVREREGLKGGHVLDPEAGLQENVVVMDYKSLYPTIMIANNICFSTLQGREFVDREKYKGIVPRILEELLEKRQILKRKAREATRPEDFRILDMTQWAVKILLNSFYGYFGYLRSRMYELIIANAVTSTGRDTIVRTKEIIENEIGRAALYQDSVYLGDDIDSAPANSSIVKLKVVYGDTDSVFVKMEPENGKGEIGDREAEALGEMMSKVLTGLLPPPMELQYEAFAKRSLFVTKKRYALYSEGKDPAIKVKGLETVRREWCNLATEAMKKVLSLLLENGDVEQASEYIKELIKNLRNNRIPIEKLVQTRSLSKRPEEYKGRQPHLELYYKIKERDPGGAPQIGDRVPFVITQGKGLLVERAEDPAYTSEHDLRIDHEYYIHRQVIPPVRRIFEALGLGVDELVADHQQMTLLESYRPDNVKKPRPKVSPIRRPPVLGLEFGEIICTNCSRAFTLMDLSEFRCPECGEELVQENCIRILSDVVELAKRAASEGGTRSFVCGNCGREYRRIPLTGTCDCSGQIVPKSVDVEVAPLLELVETAPQSMRNGNLDLQIEMIRTNFDSLRSREAPQMTLADYI